MSEDSHSVLDDPIEENLPAKKPFPGIWGSLLIVGIWLIMTVLAALAFSFLEDNFTLYITISYVVSFGGTIAIAYGLKKRQEPAFGFEMKVKDPLLIMLALFTALAFAVGVDPLTSLLPEPTELLAALKEFKEEPFLAVIALAIAPAICEELVFRGIIADGLKKRMGLWPALLISSFIFGAIHANWVQFVGATVMGLLLGWLYFKTNSLALPILVHFFNNLLATSLFLSGFEELDFSSLFNSSLTYYAVSLGGLILTGLFLWLLNKRLKSGTD